MSSKAPEQPNTDSENSAATPQPSHPQPPPSYIVDETTLSFWGKLVYRRVPQSIGIYLASSWTFLEFFESLIHRYNLSPHWQDVSLLVIVMLFPTLLILAYRHGAPGHQEWTKIEKIGIPTNILVTLMIIFSQFSDKDLGRSAETITGFGPDGSIMELERPKEEYRKRMAIGFFTLNNENANDSTDATDKALSLAIPYALKIDLQQDPFLNVFDPGNYAERLQRLGFTELSAPLALLLRVAKENRYEFLVTGELSSTKTQKLSAKVYRVSDSKLISDLVTTEYSNLFDAIDDLSVQLRSAIGFSGGHINNTIDLPIEEQLSSSLPAINAFTESYYLMNFKDDFLNAELALKEAINLDNSFAVAATSYAMMLIRQQRINEGLAILNTAKAHDYRLTDSNKFALATIEAVYQGGSSEASDIVNQWVTLYPDDADAWFMKSNMHRLFDERYESIAALRRVLELEPYGTQIHLNIGNMYRSMGDYHEAIAEYKNYVQSEPTNSQGYLLIGDTYRSLGDFDAAKENYMQAKVLLTNDNTAQRRLINLDIRLGNFEQAEAALKSYIEKANVSGDLYRAWTDLFEYYWLRGQLIDALAALDEAFSVLKAIEAESTYLLTTSLESWRYAAGGRVNDGRQILNDAAMLLETEQGQLFEINLTIAQAIFEVWTENKAQSLPMIEQVEQRLQGYLDAGTDDEIALFKGIIQYQLKQYQEAAKNLARFLERNPNDQLDMMVLHANALYQSGQLKQAEQTYQRILKQFPAHPYANLGLARIAFSQEQEQQAIPFITKVLEGWRLADQDYQPAIEARELAKRAGLISL